MGYSTDFQGSFQLSSKPTEDQVDFLDRFTSTRRMKRNSAILMARHNGNFGLNGEYGIDGEFFAMDDGNSGQDEDESIIDFNKPPHTQPGLWCQWILTEDRDALEWDGGEKFYHYIEWLKYMIDSIFSKWGIILNGQVKWQGDDMDDRGLITVTDNVVTTMDLL